MTKIQTLFMRDETKPGHPVTPVVKPECQWVLGGEGVATVKIDGTNVKIEGGVLMKRQKPKERDYDEASYVPCDRANPADRWAWEAFDAGHDVDGIYELTGPKVQGNLYHTQRHLLTRVVPFATNLAIPSVQIPTRTFQSLRDFLASASIEGIVFHHPDGRMAKIKRRDYGLLWPLRDPT